MTTRRPDSAVATAPATRSGPGSRSRSRDGAGSAGARSRDGAGSAGSRSRDGAGSAGSRSGNGGGRAGSPQPARPARAVDPRLQARRREVARREGLRRLWLVAGLTLVTSLAIGAIAVAKSTWLDVESVTVVGAGRADPQQIVTASGLLVGQPLVEVRPSAAAEAVTRVPWVATAQVDRGWRGAVTIEVTERIPLLAFPAGSRWVVADRTGRQLEIVDGPPADLLAVRGLEASGVPGQPVPDEGLAAASVVEQLSPAVAEVATGLVVEQGQILVELGSGGRANVGDERDLEAKMVALETVLNQVDLACVVVIDVRVPSAPTVRRATPADAGQDGPDASGEEPLADAGGC